MTNPHRLQALITNIDRYQLALKEVRTAMTTAAAPTTLPSSDELQQRFHQCKDEIKALVDEIIHPPPPSNSGSETEEDEPEATSAHTTLQHEHPPSPEKQPPPQPQPQPPPQPPLPLPPPPQPQLPQPPPPQLPPRPQPRQMLQTRLGAMLPPQHSPSTSHPSSRPMTLTPLTVTGGAPARGAGGGGGAPLRGLARARVRAGGRPR